MDYQRRVSGLRERMGEDGLDLVVYGAGPEYVYLTGAGLDWRAAGGDDLGDCVFVPREATPVLLVAEARAADAEASWIDEVRLLASGEDPGVAVRSLLRDLGGRGGRIALGPRLCPGVSGPLRAAAGDAEFCEAAGLTDAMRMIKEPEEIARLRAVARLADAVMTAVAAKIVEGVTQGDLEAEIALQGTQLGAAGVSFSPAAIFTKSGSQPSAEAFTYPRDEGLVPGTSIAFDFGFVMAGYCSDFGRSFYFGPADAEVAGAYRALQQAVRETVAQMRPGGMRVCDVFGAIEKVLDGLAYGQYLRARLPDGVAGHNIGLDVHENPWLRPENQHQLEANMVMAVEPKLWHSGQYYLRVEDIVLITADGAEFLTTFNRDLFEL